MAVTTPLYPPDNLARKVTDASLRHMQAEFERAASLTHAVLGSQWGHPAGTTTCLPHPNAAAAAAGGEASTSAGAGSAQWTHLFAGHDFWSAHNSFVQLDIGLAPGAAPGEDAARLKLWSGWVTSRMPRLTASLARLGLDALAFPRLVPSPHDPDTSASLFLALDLAPVPHGVFEPPSREDISGVLQAFVDGVHKGEVRPPPIEFRLQGGGVPRLIAGISTHVNHGFNCSLLTPTPPCLFQSKHTIRTGASGGTGPAACM